MTVTDSILHQVDSSFRRENSSYNAFFRKHKLYYPGAKDAPSFLRQRVINNKNYSLRPLIRPCRNFTIVYIQIVMSEFTHKTCLHASILVCI
jgi:hypothetical protein